MIPGAPASRPASSRPCSAWPRSSRAPAADAQFTSLAYVEDPEFFSWRVQWQRFNNDAGDTAPFAPPGANVWGPTVQQVVINPGTPSEFFLLRFLGQHLLGPASHFPGPTGELAPNPWLVQFFVTESQLGATGAVFQTVPGAGTGLFDRGSPGGALEPFPGSTRSPTRPSRAIVTATSSATSSTTSSASSR